MDIGDKKNNEKSMPRSKLTGPIYKILLIKNKGEK